MPEEQKNINPLGGDLTLEVSALALEVKMQNELLRRHTHDKIETEGLDIADISPLTTKGDVLTYSTVNARLAVGPNGQILESRSTETTGLKWREFLNLTNGAGFDNNWKLFYWPFAESTIQTAFWTSTVGGTGSNTHTITDSFGYVLTAVTATNAESAEYNSDATVQLNIFSQLILEFEIFTSTNFTGDKVDMGIGMNPTAGLYPGFEAQSFGYVYNSATSNYQFVTRAGAATTDLNVTALTTDTWQRLRFEILGTNNPSGPSAKCFLDDVQIGTTHTTNIPSVTTQLAIRWIMGTLTGNTTARNLRVRSVRLLMIP